jgi:hypothetical protein
MLTRFCATAKNELAERNNKKRHKIGFLIAQLIYCVFDKCRKLFSFDKFLAKKVVLENIFCDSQLKIVLQASACSTKNVKN